MVLGAQWLESMGPILLEQPPRALDGGVHFSTGDAARGVDQPHGRAPQQLRALFTKPLGLPPQRSRCHRIRLLPDTVPVAVRPYQYAHTQKTELERQCVDMLRLGIIRHNSSAFSAPVLVKKADSSWRFCVDYRALNARSQRQVPHPRRRGAVQRAEPWHVLHQAQSSLRLPHGPDAPRRCGEDDVPDAPGDL
jgi:hypothetical protein